MAWTVMATPQEIRNELPAVASSKISDGKIKANIAEAERVVTDDLSAQVFWDEIRLLSSLPRVIRRLARYKSCVITLVRQWQNDSDVVSNDEEPNSPILNYFQEQYDKLLEQIKMGDIRILDDDDEEYEYDTVRRLGLGRII